ncbi:hypothetical protein [Peribacillus deserti]|uniref:Uncharacterized protein n=1 Tax=Peribacillus deserti TaxID=673318 RepID=A0A2N5M2A5_9BACI|nr:hypothetical protein [Peribacillus deserti]PLT28498.1 hypothetical protein CUU66_18260 [Peribacillus deserti]
MPTENGTTITGLLKKVGKNYIQLEEGTVTHVIPLNKITNVNIDCAGQLLGAPEEPVEPPVEEPGAAGQRSIFDSAKPFRVNAAAEAAAAEEEAVAEEAAAEAAAVKKAMFVHTCKFCRKNHFHCDCESSSFSSSFSSSCSSSFGPSSSFKHDESSSSFKHHESSSSSKHHGSSSSFEHHDSSSSKHKSSSSFFESSSSLKSSSLKSSSLSSSFESSSFLSSSFDSSDSSSKFKKKKKGFYGAGYGFGKVNHHSRNKKDFRSFLKKLVGCVITVEKMQ